MREMEVFSSIQKENRRHGRNMSEEWTELEVPEQTVAYKMYGKTDTRCWKRWEEEVEEK
jgi:hypothetical protein